MSSSAYRGKTAHSAISPAQSTAKHVNADQSASTQAGRQGCREPACVSSSFFPVFSMKQSTYARIIARQSKQPSRAGICCMYSCFFFSFSFAGLFLHTTYLGRTHNSSPMMHFCILSANITRAARTTGSREPTAGAQSASSPCTYPQSTYYVAVRPRQRASKRTGLPRAGMCVLCRRASTALSSQKERSTCFKYFEYVRRLVSIFKSSFYPSKFGPSVGFIHGMLYSCL